MNDVTTYVHCWSTNLCIYNPWLIYSSSESDVTRAGIRKPAQVFSVQGMLSWSSFPQGGFTYTICKGLWVRTTLWSRCGRIAPWAMQESRTQFQSCYFLFPTKWKNPYSKQNILFLHCYFLDALYSFLVYTVLIFWMSCNLFRVVFISQQGPGIYTSHKNWYTPSVKRGIYFIMKHWYITRHEKVRFFSLGVRKSKVLSIVEILCITS